MKQTILIVDDDIAILEAVEFLLESEGYNVITLSNPEDLEKLFDIDEIKPDLIIMDVILSGGRDGRKIAKDLKKNKKTKSIPIILLSAHPAALKKLSKKEADGFLAKPFEIEDLLSVVKEGLKYLQEEKS
ncbi:MAG: response regulator [Candidatus Levybacteria bacterium]|nr:response regulator [Candidatus Levybacteria bacterium]